MLTVQSNAHFQRLGDAVAAAALPGPSVACAAGSEPARRRMGEAAAAIRMAVGLAPTASAVAVGGTGVALAVAVAGAGVAVGVVGTRLAEGLGPGVVRVDAVTAGEAVAAAGGVAVGVGSGKARLASPLAALSAPLALYAQTTA